MSKVPKQMPWQPSLSLICLFIIILFRSADYLSSQFIRRLHSPIPTNRPNVHITSVLSPGHSFICDCQTHINNILLNYDRKCIHVNTSFFANGDERSDSGDSSSDKGGSEPQGDSKQEDQKEEEQQKQEDPKQDEQQQEQQNVGSSRIPTYDEFARFRDSSRPPDSHYPPGPALNYRRRNSATTIPTPALLATFTIAVCILEL